MKSEQAFTAALARFKSAETDVAKLTLKLEEARARRVEAAMSTAAAEGEATKFATGTEFNPAAAADIADKQSKAGAVLELLDRGIDHVESELAGAKVDVIVAEGDCVSAQAAHHDSLLDESTTKWLHANSKQLQSLCQQLHLATIFQRVQHDGAQPTYPPTHVENLFLLILPRLVSNEFSADEQFRAGCQASLTGAPINKVVLSANVSDSERQSIAGARTRDQQLAALRKMTEQTVEVETTINPYELELAIKQHRRRIDSLRINIANVEQRIATATAKKSIPSLTVTLAIEQDKSQLKKARAELERTERNVHELEQRLQRKAA